MFVSTIPVICYYNGKILRTKQMSNMGGAKLLLCLWMYRLNARLNN